MRKCCWILLLSLVLVAPARAQETRGNISGTVRDAQGVVPGARSPSPVPTPGAAQPLVTNSSGYFEAPLLQPGNYQIAVAMTGYKSLLRPGIVVAVGQQVSVQLTLELGAVTEEITVTAALAAARHVRGVVGPELRQPHGRRAADVLQHADHADALRGRREPVHQPEPGVAGLCGWHDPGGGGGVRRRRQQHLFDRRRDQQRQRAPDRGLAELRHDSGDARRVVEFRRRRSATAPGCRLRW